MMKILPNYQTSTYNSRVNNRTLQTNPSFCGIYRDAIHNFSPVQEELLNEIKNACREPLPEFSGMTAEQYYKKKGWDYIISPDINNSVSMLAVRGLRDIRDGERISQTYNIREHINVATYDKNFKFKVSHLEVARKDYQSRVRTSFTFAILCTIVGAVMIFWPRSKSVIKESAKPLIEKVDSAAKDTAQKTAQKTINLLDTIR